MHCNYLSDCLEYKTHRRRSSKALYCTVHYASRQAASALQIPLPKKSVGKPLTSRWQQNLKARCSPNWSRPRP